MRLTATLVISTLFLILASVLMLQPSPVYAATNYALNFSGAVPGSEGQFVSRVVIPLDVPANKIDVGQESFTFEWWMKANEGQNSSSSCTTGADAWINGNIIVDRDIFGTPDLGDFGVSVYGDRIAFGAASSSSSNTICGSVDVEDGQWHHIAVTRNHLSGELSIYVDGLIDEQGMGPLGDLRYTDGRTGAQWDPYLVLGAEKHDADFDAFPSYAGIMDEFCISNTLKYTSNFTRPTTAFVPADCNVALYHFNENSNSDTTVPLIDATASPVNGQLRRLAGGAQSPQFVDADNAPFMAATPTPTPTATPSPTPTPSPANAESLCVYRDNGIFYCDSANNGGGAELVIPFGYGRDDKNYPIMGNVNASGKDDACFYYGPTLFCDTDGIGGQTEVMYNFGLGVAGGDYPVMGDLDNNGSDDLCVYRYNGWLFCDLAHNGGGSEYKIRFGAGQTNGDWPVILDVDRNGTNDFCIYRGNTLFCDTANNGPIAEFSFKFGQGQAQGDFPVAGDIDGNGLDEFCIYRNGGTLYCDTAGNGPIAEFSRVFGVGVNGRDFPVVGFVQ